MMGLKRRCKECGNDSVDVKPLSLAGSLSCSVCSARYEYPKSSSGIHKVLTGIVTAGTILCAIVTVNTIITTLVFILLLLIVFCIDLFMSYKTRLKLIGIKAIRKRLRDRRT